MKIKMLTLSLGAALFATGCAGPVQEAKSFGQWFGDSVTNDGGYSVATRDAFVLKPPAPKQEEMADAPLTNAPLHSDNMLDDVVVQNNAPTSSKQITEDLLLTAPQNEDEVLSPEPEYEDLTASVTASERNDDVITNKTPAQKPKKVPAPEKQDAAPMVLSRSPDMDMEEDVPYAPITSAAPMQGAQSQTVPQGWTQSLQIGNADVHAQKNAGHAMPAYKENDDVTQMAYKADAVNSNVIYNDAPITQTPLTAAPAQQADGTYTSPSVIVNDLDSLMAPQVTRNTAQGANFNSGSVTVFALDDDTSLSVPYNSGQMSPEYMDYPIASHASSTSNGSVTVHHYDDIFGDADGYAPVGSYSNGAIPTYNQPRLMMTAGENAIYFKHGSAALSADDKKMIADFIASAGPQSITVIGHSSKPVYTTEDPVQKSLINLKMSAKRAESVAAALLEAGLTPGRVETVAKGDANSTSEGNKDRRVEILLRR